MTTYVYAQSKFHVCVLPTANRKWKAGQIYGCECGNMFIVVPCYEGKYFRYFGKIASNDTR